MHDYLETINSYPVHSMLGGKVYMAGMQQNPRELNYFLNFLVDKNIKSYVEIGLGQGYLLRFITEELKLTTTGIEIHQDEKHFGLNIIYGSSDDPSTIAQAPEADLYFIDGDHSYSMVSKDFFNYKDKCTYMAFHDVLGMRNCEGVGAFWKELKSIYTYWEFLEEDTGLGSGIGVIKLK